MSKGTLWIKKQLLKVLIFFQTLHIFERIFTVLGEKVFGRDIKIELCTFCLQSIILRKKIYFWKFWKFFLIRTWNIKILDLWQQSFHPGSQKSFLGVYMSSLRDVGIRRDITWRETFFGPWLKNFDLFLKTAFCVSRGTILVKKVFFESSVFYQTLRNFERTFTVLGEKVFGRDIKIEKCSFSLIRSTKKSNYWKFSLFIKIFRTLNEHLPCVPIKFCAGISKMKIVLHVFRVSCCG